MPSPAPAGWKAASCPRTLATRYGPPWPASTTSSPNCASTPRPAAPSRTPSSRTRWDGGPHEQPRGHGTGLRGEDSAGGPSPAESDPDACARGPAPDPAQAQPGQRRLAVLETPQRRPAALL